MLKRAPSLTDQVKAHIKQQILSDKFEDGRIPAETDLANQLGVSRTTVRDALSRLEIEGVIFRKQGAGTFVNKAGLRIKMRMEEIWSYEQVLEAHDYTPTTIILAVQEHPAGADLAAELKIEPGSPLVAIHKLFLADGEPVVMTVNHIPAGIISRPYTTADLQRPIFHFLLDYCQQHLTYYLSDIIPTLATPTLAATLHLPPQSALISFEEIGYNTDNEPVVKAFSYFRDELLRLRLIRREVI